MKKYYLLLLILCVQINISAQQTPTYSQYMDNLFMLNPAAAGAYGISVLNLTTRQQWWGVDGAPRTHSVSFQGRILKKNWLLKGAAGLFGGGQKFVGKTNGRVGQGAMVFTDKSGLIRRTGFQYSYAYHVFVGQTQFSGGLSAQVYQMSLDRQGAIVNSPNDPILLSNGNIWVPDFNAGIFMTHRSFYAGISANSLAQSALGLGNDAINYNLKRFYYVVTGYTFYTKNVYIEPSLLYKTTGRYGNQLDLSTRVTFKHLVWVGASVRTNGDIVALTGVRVGDWYIGYAFDYGTSTFKLNTYGTHEVSLSYKMGSTERRFRWQERY